MANRNRSRSRDGRRGQSWWRQRPPLWATIALVVVVAVVTWLLARPSSVERRAEELREESATRDVEVGEQLVEVSVATVPQVQAVLDDTWAALPEVDGTEPVEQPATRAEVDQWRGVVGQILADLDEVGSAGSEVNVARNGLVGAAEQLLVVCDLYDVARQLPEEEAASLLTATATARRAAVETWNTAAIQVDVVSIDTGQGHSHVYVAGAPGEPLPDDGGD